MRKRADFVKARRGRRISRPSFTLQVLPNELNFARVGFTVTKRLGSAVIRNRIKRRLRSAAREILPSFGLPGHDYVLLARPAAQFTPYDRLLDELRTALLDPRDP